jgi:hypothetical protein
MPLAGAARCASSRISGPGPEIAEQLGEADRIGLFRQLPAASPAVRRRRSPATTFPLAPPPICMSTMRSGSTPTCSPSPGIHPGATCLTSCARAARRCDAGSLPNGGRSARSPSIRRSSPTAETGMSRPAAICAAVRAKPAPGRATALTARAAGQGTMHPSNRHSLRTLPLTGAVIRPGCTNMADEHDPVALRANGSVMLTRSAKRVQTRQRGHVINRLQIDLAAQHPSP